MIFNRKNKNILIFWYKKVKNIGDALNPFLIEKISNKNVKWVKPRSKNKHYICIGSILQAANKYTEVWGSGFISASSYLAEKPLRIWSVRGPLSRKKLISLGIDCPEIYGDPALLLPRMYYPKIEKKYKIGIVPHYVDKHNVWLNNFKNDNDIKIIDVQKDDPLKFIDDILSCKTIASSSLHGIITADAYNIPSLWLEFSNKVSGKGFKFLDYFMSVKRKEKEPIVINNHTNITEIFNKFYTYRIDIDIDDILKNCPFI